MKKRLLITGSNGVLGTKLIAAALDGYEVLGIDIQEKCQNSYLGRFSYRRLDITDKNAVQSGWKEFKPEIVVHAAAFTDVDKAEEQRELCRAVNIDGTECVTVACEQIRAKLAYISTDYVFDGQSGPYSEDDEAHPLGWYARTKYEGEQIVRKTNPDSLICRTMALYGFAPHITRFNFVGWLIDSLLGGKEVKVVTDQMVNHTLADDMARVVLKLLAREAGGTFHTAGNERLSRYDFALRLARYFDFKASLVKPISSQDLGWIADRPLQGGLKMDKLNRIGIHTMDTAQQLHIVRQTFSWPDGQTQS